MHQVELFPNYIELDLISEILFLRKSMRQKERKIHKISKEIISLRHRISIGIVSFPSGIISIQNYKLKNRYRRIMRLKIELLSVYYELYDHDQCDLAYFYGEINKNIRLVRSN